MPGREWKPNRRQRRILLVLMTGAPELSGYPISRLAQTGSGSVYPTLARLESLGWVTSEWEQGGFAREGRRRFYTLTPDGRENVARLLGMRLPGDLFTALLMPGEEIVTPERAEQLGLTVEARHLREQLGEETGDEH